MSSSVLKLDFKVLESAKEFPVYTVLTRVLIEALCPLIQSEVIFGEMNPLTGSEKFAYWLDAKVSGELDGFIGVGIDVPALKQFANQLNIDEDSEADTLVSALSVIFESLASSIEKQFASEDFQSDLKKRSGLQENYSISVENTSCYVCPVETRFGSFKVFFNLNASSPELQEEISSRQAILEPRKIRVYASQLEAVYARMKNIEQLERQFFTGPNARTKMRSEIKRVKRMVRQMKSEPLQSLFLPAQKLVQEIAKEQEKEIQFVSQGTWLYLDKSLLNHLYEPMLHLFRNAVDHGIEMPSERERKGKPSRGTIKTRAAFSENELRLIISDDGVGFDYEKIREKAQLKGLISERQSQTLLSEELAPLVFHSGFSTRDSADAFSGRGLGLDIVKRGMESIGGEARVVSSTSFGTSIELLIPLNEDFSALKIENPSTPVTYGAEEEEKILLLDELMGYLERLNLSLQAISKEKKASAAYEAYRLVQSVKGVVGFLNWSRVASLCHHYEDLLKLVAEEKAVLDNAQVDLIVETGVCIKSLCEAFKENHSYSMFHVRRLEARILQAIWVASQNEDRGHFFLGKYHLGSLQNILGVREHREKLKVLPELDFQKALSQPHGTLVQFNGERIGYAGLLVPEETFEKCILPRVTGKKSRVSIKYHIEALTEFGKNMGRDIADRATGDGASVRALSPLTYYGWGQPLKILGKPTYCYSVEFEGFIFYLVGDFRLPQDMQNSFPLPPEVSINTRTILDEAKKQCQIEFHNLGVPLNYHPLSTQSDLIGFEGGVTSIISCSSLVENEPEMTLFLSYELGLAKALLQNVVQRDSSENEGKTVDLFDCLNELSNGIGGNLMKALEHKGLNFQLSLPSIYTGKASVNNFNRLYATHKLTGITSKGKFELQVLVTQPGE